MEQLREWYKKCSDGGLHPEYKKCLNKLKTTELTQEHIDFLCEIICSKKHFWEFHLTHLEILLLNPSSKKYDLKSFYAERIARSRRLAIKIFFIRGFSQYASEEELEPIMKRFCNNLEKNHDYIDYEYILSAPGLPYLVQNYGYSCFETAYKKAKEEYAKISSLLRGYFTLNEEFEQITLLPNEEAIKRMRTFIEQHKTKQ